MEKKYFHSRDYSESDYKVAEDVRKELQEGRPVEWYNDYETFYGVGWMSWVKKQLADVPCEIEVTMWCKWVQGMPWGLRITPKQ